MSVISDSPGSFTPPSSSPFIQSLELNDFTAHNRLVLKIIIMYNGNEVTRSGSGPAKEKKIFNYDNS